ncbi:MAG: class I SAM-dependent methyltransferase [Bacteroidia bacterium]|nr:class I SAM-dependent methyltransferase [Bacteroidia bacterium]
MPISIEQIIEIVQSKDPLHAKKLKRNLKNLESDYKIKCNLFLEKYDAYLASTNKTLENGVDDYLHMISDFIYEQLRFNETGKYSNTSFEEVNERVYNNPEVMSYFMNGLLLSQVLWKHHYAIFLFFSRNFLNYSGNCKKYLEVGGGHGLFISEAIKQLPTVADFTLLDISPTSIEVSKKFVKHDFVNYILSDVFEYNPESKFDFITMGEVLEHVEDPVALLKKLKSLLNKGGKLFITTPTNAPSIDHIFLFRDENDVKKVIEESGLEIVNDFKVYAEDLPEETAKELKITMMYACFLQAKV